jgi:hypothetical protein
VDRESDPPPLEIELISTGSRSTTSADEQCSAARTGSNHRRRTRWLFACTAAIVVALVVTSLTADDSDTDDDVSPATTARVEPTTTAAPTTVVPTTTWTATPNLLGGARTGLKMWSFAADSRLQVLDFDTGSLLSLSDRGGEGVLALDDGSVAIWGYQTGASLIGADGSTIRRGISSFGPPTSVPGTASIWVRGDGQPRRWELHDRQGVTDTLPPESAEVVVPLDERTVLLVDRTGTSAFDRSTRTTTLVTTTPVIAAGGSTMIGLRCNGERCVLSAIDFVSRQERILRTDHPIDDVRNWALSPDGRYLAISRKAVGQGRFAQIIEVATSLVVWNSPDGISFAGVGPAWSWSPDATRFFVTMSTERVIAADVRAQPFKQTDIAIPLVPLHGIAVTAS